MSVFLVSYDLRAPGRDYSRLYTRLSGWRAVKALESDWLIDAETTAYAIRDDLMSYVDANDRLLVAKLEGQSAWTSALHPDAARLLQDRFGAV